MIINLVAIISLAVIAVAAMVYYLFPTLAVATIEALARSGAGLKKRSIIIDDIKWSYLEGGKTGSETLLLLHGFGAAKENWVSYAGHLAKHKHVICPDLPGFGESSKNPELHYNPRTQAQRLHNFIKELNISTVHLAGNSMGGMITLRYALEHPQNLGSITLIAPGGISGANKSALDLALERGENPLIVKSSEDVDTLLSYSMYKPVRLPRPFKKVIVAKALENEKLHGEIFEEIIQELDQAPLEPELSKIKAPALVMWGRHDKLLDVSGLKVLEEHLPNSQSLILEKTGHLPMMESPEESARKQLSFVELLSKS